MERHRLGDRRRRGSCGFPNAAGQHLACQTAEAVHAEPDVQAVRADVNALDQQRHDAGLLGGEEFVPQRVELLQGRAGVGLGDVVGVGTRRLPCPRNDLWLAEHGAELVEKGLLDSSGGEQRGGCLFISLPDRGR